MADLFNKLAGSLNKGVATASANSKALLEKSKIKSAISNLENERKQLVAILGQKVYASYKTTGEIPIDDTLTNLCGEITKRLELIEQQEAQMIKIDEEVSLIVSGTKSAGSTTCVCGHTNNSDAKFCASCGTATAI